MKTIALAGFASFFFHLSPPKCLLTSHFFLCLPHPYHCCPLKILLTCLGFFSCYNVKVKILTLPSMPHATLLCLHLISFPCIPQLAFHIPHSPLTLLLLLSAFHALIFALSFMLPMCLEQSLASQPIYSFA